MQRQGSPPGTVVVPRYCTRVDQSISSGAPDTGFEARFLDVYDRRDFEQHPDAMSWDPLVAGVLITGTVSLEDLPATLQVLPRPNEQVFGRSPETLTPP